MHDIRGLHVRAVTLLRGGVKLNDRLPLCTSMKYFSVESVMYEHYLDIGKLRDSVRAL
jgi:hypothetical protein